MSLKHKTLCGAVVEGALSSDSQRPSLWKSGLASNVRFCLLTFLFKACCPSTLLPQEEEVGEEGEGRKRRRIVRTKGTQMTIFSETHPKVRRAPRSS